jgi:hypothetical protein
VGWDLPLSNMDAFTKAIDQLAQFTQNDFDTMCEHAYGYAQLFVKNEEVLKVYGEMLGRG